MGLAPEQPPLLATPPRVQRKHLSAMKAEDVMAGAEAASGESLLASEDEHETEHRGKGPERLLRLREGPNRGEPKQQSHHAVGDPRDWGRDEPHGEERFKGIPEPVKVYRVEL